MRNKFTIVLLILVSALHSKIYSQLEHACKASEQNELVFKNNPEARKEYIEFNKYSRELSKTQKRQLPATYTIPVVVHVYGATQNGATVTAAKVEEAIDKLNLDFQGLNDDFGDVDPYFNARKSTLDIEFKLAKLDPNGNCTNGVVFYADKAGYGGVYSDAAIAVDAWDNYKYMNVYIQADLYGDGSTTNSGVAWYPNSSMSDQGTARVVYNGAYLHANTGKEFASVFTHEFGHFFNLIHTFEGGCTYPNDEVDDTPAEDADVVGANCAPVTNCEGNYVNYENYMGYNGAADGCYRMFTKGQTDRMLAALQHPARVTLWQPANLTATGVNNTGSSLAVDNTIIKESVANNGSFNQTVTVTLNGVDFYTSSGTLTQNTDYTLTLPQGLSATMQITSLTTAELTITGTAANHLDTDNETINLGFNSSAFSGGQSLSCSSVGLDFKFYSPFEIIYDNITDISASTANPWDNLNLTLINGDNTYGTWAYVQGHLKIETYGKKLVTNAGTRDITLLDENVLVSTASNFTAPGDYPDQLDVKYDGYTAWQGQIGYIGFTTDHNGETVHGWMKAGVSSDGETLTVYEYAFSTEPNGDIKTGQTLMDANASEILIGSNVITETTENTGGINFTTTINVSGAAVFSNKTFVEGVDYTTTMPNNYTVQVNYVGDKEVTLSISGSATNHAQANSTTYDVTFTSAAFNNGYNDIVNKTNSFDLNFLDPYTIITGVLNASVDSALEWQWFSIAELDAGFNDFGAWIFAANHLKVETYGKRFVTNPNSLNIALIGSGELISAEDNFTAPGDYPDQLDLYTSTHTDWNATTGYIGFESMYNGNTVLGWLKVSVDANGTGYTISEYAFYTKPESPITAGSLVIPSPTPTNITWTGAIDNNWNNASNWSSNTVPTSTSDIIIPANLNQFPTINTPTTVNTVVIESGATLITNSTLTAAVTYKRNLATSNWYLIASPLNNETLANMVSNNIFAASSSGTIGIAPYMNDGTAWDYQMSNATVNITSGKGYSVKLKVADDLIFTGSTNSTNVILPVTTDVNNYNLIGNPYTSYINLGEFFNANPLNNVVSEATVWLWNQATGSYELKLANIDDSFQIAPGQAFFISAAANTNVTFDKNNQSHTAGTFQKQANSKTQVNLTVTSNNGDAKTTKLYYLSGVTTGFDNGYDGSVFKGAKNNFSVFTKLVNKENNTDYAVQSLPIKDLETTIVPVGIKANAGETVVFSAESFNLPNNVQVYIEDTENGEFVNLSKENYTVVLSKNANSEDQFFIHTTSNRVNGDADVLNTVSVYQSAKNQLTVTGLQADNNSIVMYSAIGKQVMAKTFNANGNTVINLPKVSSGVYIVNVTSGAKKVNKKIILNN
ncbi:M43 family zinc metalloprotease [Tenacibaculum aestuariivivum]|uniref:M43 family zinc metalloprotease n=1 Tax=Tenacibaculum aestuariivivum TaxID=2006131 RepID=UPI003AB848EE